MPRVQKLRLSTRAAILPNGAYATTHTARERGRSKSHKLSLFERPNVFARQSKPLALRVFWFKTLMPIGFDSEGVVRPDGVDQFQVFRQLYRYLIRPAPDKNSFANLVTLLPPDFQQGHIHEAFYRGCGGVGWQSSIIVGLGGFRQKFEHITEFWVFCCVLPDELNAFIERSEAGQ